MNETLKGACFDEITHLICDADKKVNISDVSNNWNISHRDSEAVLLEWIEKNRNQTLNKEFLIRGMDNSGNCVITVLPEDKLDFVQKKFEKSCYSLYSIELASKSNVKRLNGAKPNECKWINLPAKHVERDIVAKSPPPIQSVKDDEQPATSKKGIKSMFSASETVKKVEVKQEPQNVDTKTEKETPKKQSPKKKEPIKTPKMASGKSSISSFFSKSSSVGAQPKKEALPKPVKKEESSNMFDDHSSMEVDEVPAVEKVEKEEKKPVSAKTNKKRSIVDVDDGDSGEIPGTPQDTKKLKKITKKISEKSRLSRIVKMEDSSDDDDNQEEQRKLLASPVKEKENKTPPKKEKAPAEKGKRRKAKKTVSRTFKDEEGYLVTKNEIVEYSCSEEETEVVAAEPVQPAKEVQSAEVSEKTTKKKKTSPSNANSKQGSILSFFSKK
ncbi:hypothetical protein HA402_014516 [Bradysia odoriphaga]|nr:hypothetical protein HA402_014516 [Bradysia odoriphaga]